MYEIQSKSDFQSGATLVVRVPEEEIDKKALYTIVADRPEFILPFRHRGMDGEIEFTYQVGNRSKLDYLSRNRSPGEYSVLWSNLLQPLIDCKDWFMSPYSFVFSHNHLYCGKDCKSISYVYIPSVRPCSDDDALKSMVVEVAKRNHVSDAVLENKVMWAIQDFNAGDFLQLVQPYKSFSKRGISHEVSEKREVPQELISEPEVIKHDTQVALDSVSGDIDEISIHFPSDEKVVKVEKFKSNFFGNKKEKPTKIQRPKEKNGLSGKKKAIQQEIKLGAAADPKRPLSNPFPYAPPLPIGGNRGEETQLDEMGGSKFRYIGEGNHPKKIDIDIEENSVFTIGRFDVSVNVKQSDFEFDSNTKAVSRHHAAVERKMNGYFIIDLDSSAGTFVNGRKSPINVPAKIERGDRVSFGYSGADYIWEE